ncbi:hypothetical protein MCUN1_002303 [Malassezia cuniculi]|uniref:Small ribosomal subunit protein mS38 n=1 Tax=Malassezia cuniculi TaxID=948313 RepID=A0AAF0EVR8_9BASI|nr:hypothetical protein MCUN1_002303 [Malassezia cuniculi]
MHTARVSLARRPSPRMLTARPPPTSEPSLAMQRLYAQHRPLLEHELLPPRPVRLLRDFDEEIPRGSWRHKARSVDTATFNEVIDRLASASLRRRRSGRSPAVQAAAKHIERRERDADEREEAVANAVERGEDPARAERLGAEAELVVLGEPDGSNADWAPGVATHLGTTQAFVPPSAPGAVRRAMRPAETDEDAHLWLMHGLVQTRVGAAREWEAFVAERMDPVQHTHVDLDSVRRKRRKKMNKHKYKKLRKKQRAERQRLKK